MDCQAPGPYISNLGPPSRPANFSPLAPCSVRIWKGPRCLFPTALSQKAAPTSKAVIKASMGFAYVQDCF